MATAKIESGFTDDWQGEKTLAECNFHMLKTADTCDVTFRVGQNEDIVLAHRYILISRSCVFYSMLCYEWSKDESIKIPDVSKEFFTSFLNFLYTDDCSLTADNVTGLLYLSKKYAVHRLHRLCLSFLQTNLTPENACVVLEQAHFFDEDELFEQALTIVTTNGNVSLLTSGFRDLCRACLNKVLISNDLDIHTKPEVVFDGTLSWTSAECSRQGKEVTPSNQRDVLGETVYLIGFTGFDAAGFVKKVVPSQLLAENEAFKILSNIACPDKDVGRFRIVNPKSKMFLSEIDVYGDSCKPNDYDRYLFQMDMVHDPLIIKCDKKALLLGITLVPSEAKYEIAVTQADKTIMTTEYTTKLSNLKMEFPSSITLEPGLKYCVKVEFKSGKCPLLIMKYMRGWVSRQNKKFHFCHNSLTGHITKGLIMKLTVS